MRLNTVLSGAAFAVAAGVFLSASLFNSERSYSPREQHMTFGEAQEANGAIEYAFKLRKNPITGQMDYEAMAKAWQEVAQNAAAVNAWKKNNGSVQSATLNWTEIGPSNVGGRTRALLIDRNNPNRIYAGGVAGGLWISNDKAATWTKWTGSDQLANMTVASIAQAPNGDIYVGTGEGNYAFYGTGAGGLIGGGVWKSTDGGNTFNVLPSTVPAPNATGGPWVAVNAIKTDPNNSNKIYAATNYGLRLSTNGGASWSHPIRLINGSPNTQNTTDVEVGSDGVVFAAVNSKCYKSANGDSASFTNISVGGAGKLPSTASGRLELGISPTDPNFVYATCTGTSSLAGVYQSVDKGVTWAIIGPGGSSQFNPFGTTVWQGDYDNILTVDPANKGRVVLGGVELWSWKQNTPTSYGQGQWTQIATEFGFSGIKYYVHSDKHAIEFDKTNPNICYIGCDGGVFRSLDMGNLNPTYGAANFGYNVTQTYAVAYEPNNTSVNKNGVIMGCQDNGSQYINGNPNGGNQFWADQIGGGDGGEVEISQLNPNAFFTTVYYGSLSRSSNKGGSSSSFYSSKITKGFPTLGQPGFASFVTPISLYENANATNSPDSVMWIADQNYAQNTVVGVQSKTNNQWFGYTLPNAVNQGDTLMIQDRVVSKIVVGFSGNNGVWLTKQAIDFSASPTWYHIAGSATAGHQVSGTVESFGWSANGDILYFGTDNGTLYRLTNLAGIVDSLTGDIGDNVTANSQCIITQAMIKSFGAGRAITGISVDPTNPDNVAVTLANYGYLDYVYYSSNATQASPTFTSKQGISGTKLPTFPCYGVILEKTNPKRAIIATEYGVYKTDDITASTSTIVWTQENNNQLPNTAAFAIRQQRLEPWHTVQFGGTTTPVTNSGRIYVGTHGRGVWACDNYYTPASLTSVQGKELQKSSLLVYPNPSSGQGTLNFFLAKSGDVTLNIYDLNGKMVKTFKKQDAVSGAAQMDFDARDLDAGTYLLSLDAAGTRSTARFVIVK